MSICRTALSPLIHDVITYMTKMSYSSSRIQQYQSAWNKLRLYMKNHSLHEFNATVAESFVYDFLHERSFDELKRGEKDIIQCVNLLTEYQETGMVKYRRCQKFRELHGEIGKAMRVFLDDKKRRCIAHSTIEEYKIVFQFFLAFLERNHIQSIHQISIPILLQYCNQTAFCTPYVRHRDTRIVKQFLRYLYEQLYTECDLSQCIPKVRYVKQPKLPSTYSRQEIESMLQAVERSSPKGKRDYAILLLIARLGLRCSDVCTMCFENLHWKTNRIELIQQKTKKRIELPLLQDIGEAIIDYLRYGRPKSTMPYLFLHAVAPFDRLNTSTIHSIVTLYLRRAKISMEPERKHGPHALRHSLVGILLEKKTPLPIISEVLGHTNTESTRYYLRIDTNTLRQCTLEVPAISTAFYQGGVR